MMNVKFWDALLGAFGSAAFAIFIWNDGSIKWALVTLFVLAFMGYLLKAFNAFMEPIVEFAKAIKGQ